VVSDARVALGALAVPVASAALAALVVLAESVALVAQAASVELAVREALAASVAQGASAAGRRLEADRASPLCRPTDQTLEAEVALARPCRLSAPGPWGARSAAAWRIVWAIARRPRCRGWETIGPVRSGTGVTHSMID
jgi:hypothetical protein